MPRRVAYVCSIIVLALTLAIPSATAQRGHSPDFDDIESASGWNVTDIQAIDFDGHLASLSPDGQWIAGVSRDETFCVFEVATGDTMCDDAPEPIHIPSIVWSPDSTAVAYSLDALIRLYDSDIFVFELAEGASVNLTDDGLQGGLMTLSGEDEIPVDLSPAWSPDGTSLVFARSMFGENAEPGTTLLSVSRDGGEPEHVSTVGGDTVFAVIGPMFVLQDGSVLYAHWENDRSAAANGIWLLSANGEATQLLDGSTEGDFPLPLITDVYESEDGSSVMIAGHSHLAFSVGEVDRDLSFVLDVLSGHVTPLTIDSEADISIVFPALSPDGSAVVAVAIRGEGDQLLIVSGGSSELIDLGTTDDARRFSAQSARPPDWVDGDVIFAPPGMVSMPYLLTVERTDHGN